MNSKLLNEKIGKYIDVEKNKSVDIICDSCEAKLEDIRNSLYKVGTVLDQDLESNLFIANVKSGFLNSLQTLVCVYLENKKINYKLYSANGKLDEKSAKNIVDKINEKIGIKECKKKHLICKIICILIFLLILFIGIYSFIFYKNTQAYNSWVNLYNSKLQIYKEVITKVDISNIDSFQNVYDSLNIVNTDLLNILMSIKEGNNPIKIVNDIDLIKNEISKLDRNIDIVSKITNPNVKDIEVKIKKSQYVKKTEIVSDIDKKKEWFDPIHTFKDCIYFELNDVKYDGKGITTVEKGTDAGGCIEIYKTLEEARNRYDYLMSFDNTIYYSGQFIVVGTMVVRTSYKLSNENNLLVVNDLIKLIIE